MSVIGCRAGEAAFISRYPARAKFPSTASTTPFREGETASIHLARETLAVGALPICLAQCHVFCAEKRRPA
ncbi:hypothetical protein GQ53DRAFT_750695 [Thozetella sp. PMI_491]|nr:hypothetical protein GQ53DRAFT_750695 [Thozetella sp. PMI_491]